MKPAVLFLLLRCNGSSTRRRYRIRAPFRLTNVFFLQWSDGVWHAFHVLIKSKIQEAMDSSHITPRGGVIVLQVDNRDPGVHKASEAGSAENQLYTTIFNYNKAAAVAHGVHIYIQLDQAPFTMFCPFWAGPVIFVMTVGTFKEADVHLTDTDLCLCIPVLEKQAGPRENYDTFHVTSDIGSVANAGLVAPEAQLGTAPYLIGFLPHLPTSIKYKV